MSLLFGFLCLTGVGSTQSAEGDRVFFSIPAQRADRSLTVFARQAGLSVLFPYDEVSQVDANGLDGAYEIDEGLRILLQGTGLSGSVQNGTRLTVRESGAERKETESGLLSRLMSVIGTALNGSESALSRYDEGDRGWLDEITVTGSRIGRDGFNSAQPRMLMDSEMLDELGIVNTGEAMSLIPANLGNWTPTAKPGGNESVPLNVYNGLHLANLRGLNPTYGSRTLTLVNSRRHMPTNQGDGVDLNMIPGILIDRVEVVTGGASASYGSGAIGGVVNILLNDELDGVRGEFGLGQTERGEGENRYLGLAWGGDIGEAGHLTLGFEAEDTGPIENCIDHREWCRQGAYIVENRQYETDDEPNFVYREDVRTEMRREGVLPFAGQVFDESGNNVVPYQTADRYRVGGEGQHIYRDTTLRTNVDRKVAYFDYEQHLRNALRFYFSGSLGRVTSWTPQDGIDLYGAKLAADNYYLNRLSDNPCETQPDSCFISKDFSSQVETVNDTTTDLYRFRIGASGYFGDSSWIWDAYYQTGRSRMSQIVHNSRHALRMQFALDAVDDGDGNPVCRVSRDGIDASFDGDPRLADGCAPLDLFGMTPVPAEARDYSWGRILEDTRVTQDMVEMVASGDIGKGFGAGPVKAAIGLSWRKESLRNLADERQPDYIRTDYNSQFGESFGGDVAVSEYFTELVVPVTDNIDLQLAGRRSHYKNTGGVGTGLAGESFSYDINTWKINSSWRPTDWLTLQASRSRDLRAPNFRELYYGKVFPRGSNFGYCDNPWTGNRFEDWYTFTGDSCRAELRGGIDLGPEKADTTTVGFALSTPRRTARLGVDYYRIQIEDAITPASWFYTIDQCHLHRNPEFCSLIEGPLIDPDDPLSGFSRIDVVSSKSLNQLYYETRGIDVTADWVRSFDFGTLSMRFIATHMMEQLVQPDATSSTLLDIAGVTGSPGEGFDWEPAPDWSAQWFTTLERGDLSMTLHARYISEGIKDAERTGPGQPGFDPGQADSIDDNTVPDYFVWGMTGSYEFDLMGTRAQLFGSVQNLFDRDPPLIGTGIGGTNPVLFDTIGRRYRLGLRVEFQ